MIHDVDEDTQLDRHGELKKDMIMIIRERGKQWD